MLFGARIGGIGYELGEELVTNQKISELVDARVVQILGRIPNEEERAKLCTNPEWIFERTGINTRYFAAEKTATSDLAASAVKKAIEHSHHKIQDCKFIVVATVTPDYLYAPPTGALIQDKIGFASIQESLDLQECFIVDAASACSSFGAALRLGYSLIASGQFLFGVVVAADKMSVTMNFADRNFCVLLGDAAAAVTLEATSPEKGAFWRGPSSFFSWSDGSKGDVIITRVGGSARPFSSETIDGNQFERPDKLWQNGRRVFKDMNNLLYSAEEPQQTIIGQALFKANVRLPEIDFIFFHQANKRITAWAEAEMRKNGFTGRVFNTIDRFGNTTSPTIPLGMAVAYEEGHLKNGHKVLTCAFGGGYTAGTALFEWTI